MVLPDEKAFTFSLPSQSSPFSFLPTSHGLHRLALEPESVFRFTGTRRVTHRNEKWTIYAWNQYIACVICVCVHLSVHLLSSVCVYATLAWESGEETACESERESRPDTRPGHTEGAGEGCTWCCGHRLNATTKFPGLTHSQSSRFDFCSVCLKFNVCAFDDAFTGYHAGLPSRLKLRLAVIQTQALR